MRRLSLAVPNLEVEEQRVLAVTKLRIEVEFIQSRFKLRVT